MAGQREHIASVSGDWRVAWRAGGPTALSPQVAQAIVSGGVPSHRRFELCPPVVVLVSSVNAPTRSASMTSKSSRGWSMWLNDLATTQRYMHLSPAALDAAIRLLETGSKFREE